MGFGNGHPTRTTASPWSAVQVGRETYPARALSPCEPQLGALIVFLTEKFTHTRRLPSQLQCKSADSQAALCRKFERRSRHRRDLTVGLSDRTSLLWRLSKSDVGPPSSALRDQVEFLAAVDQASHLHAPALAQKLVLGNDAAYSSDPWATTVITVVFVPAIRSRLPAQRCARPVIPAPLCCQPALRAGVFRARRTGCSVGSAGPGSG